FAIERRSIFNCKSQISILITSQHPNYDSLHLAAIGVHDPWLHCAVGRLQADLRAFLVESLKSCFAAVQQGDNLFTVAGGFTALDDNVISITKMIVDHAVAADP